jgi:hypothetical protein
MALNNSGPISFGGATAGQSINLELGVSATALASINSTAFRNLAGVSSGQISLNTFYGKSSVSYFIGIYGPTASASATQINGATVDSSGNFYFSSRAVPSTGSTNSYWSLVKYDTAGALQFQKKLATGQYSQMQNVGKDSSNNIYACGLIYDAPSGFYRTGIVKYNSSGVVQWQKFYSVGQENVGQIAVDTSGNVYVISGGSGAGCSLIKLNTSGTEQWQTDLYDGLGMRFNAVISNGSSVFVAANQAPSFSFDTKIFLHSFDASNGSRNFSRQTSVLTYVRSSGVAYDSSGNIYLTAYYNYENASVLIKFNSSGTLQWSLNSTGTGGNFQDVAVDSSGNVYTCGTEYTGNARLLIVKVNSSGTVQWKRRLGAGIPSGNGYAITIDSSGSIYAAGFASYAGGPDKALFIKLPSDGSKTGTYSVDGNNWVYEASTITISSGSITDSNINPSQGTPGYPLVTTSYAQSDDSIPNTLTTI